MIGSCEICDRQNVPVSHYNECYAHPEVDVCFLCQGQDDPDPHSEMEEPAVCDMSQCPQCGLKAETLEHRFCEQSPCPVRESLKERATQ